MKVMALDPGGTTGVAIMEFDRLTILKGGREERHWTIDDDSLHVCQLGTPQEDFAALRLFDLIVRERPGILIMEDFRLFPNMKHSPDPNGTLPDRYLARLDLLLYLWREKRYVVSSTGGVAVVDFLCPLVRKQMPGERDVITDAFIKKNGWWRTEKKDGGGPHSMDALRHLLVYYAKIRNGGEL